MIQEANRHVAAGIVNAVALIDPEVMILGGGWMNSRDLFLPKMIKSVKRLAPMQTEIRVRQLSTDAGALRWFCESTIAPIRAFCENLRKGVFR